MRMQQGVESSEELKEEPMMKALGLEPRNNRSAGLTSGYV